jgi:transposase
VEQQPNPRKHHSQQYIDSIIKLVKIDGLPVSQVAQQTGLRANMIYRWLQKQELAAARRDPTSVVAVEEQLRAAQRENELLKKQVEFLKKAATYFASQSSSDISSSGNTPKSRR